MIWSFGFCFDGCCDMLFWCLRECGVWWAVGLGVAVCGGFGWFWWFGNLLVVLGAQLLCLPVLRSGFWVWTLLGWFLVVGVTQVSCVVFVALICGAVVCLVWVGLWLVVLWFGLDLDCVCFWGWRFSLSCCFVVVGLVVTLLLWL